MKKALISVIGPTAIGKTKLAISIANHYNTEIISADSRQFFKEMRIGTAVPTDDELASAPHHFIQHKSVFEPYSVGDFEKDALKCIEELFKKHDVVILVGGSGLYVDVVVKGLDEFPEIDPNIRVELNKLLKEKGIEHLQNLLKKHDTEYAGKIDLMNPHRIIRALEVCLQTGKPYSSFLNQKKNTRPFKTITIGITADRELIYERINKRVDLMMQEGLLKEAEALVEHKHLNALQTVGYRELFQYLNGIWELDFAVSEIKKNTRRFAKRQLTWFKKNEKAKWFKYNQKPEAVFKYIDEQLTMNTNFIFYIMGVSGCGKSTIGALLASEFDIPFFDGDDFHPQANVDKMAAGNALNDDDRQGWLIALNNLAINNPTGAVIACSALKESYRVLLSKNIENRAVFVHLDGTYEQIQQRMSARKDHFMPDSLLKSQFDTLEQPKKAITVSIIKSPEEIIIDIKKSIKQV